MSSSSSVSRRRPPKYAKHKATGQARVTIDGKSIYLGQYGSAESKERYARLIAELSITSPISPTVPASGMTISEVILAYWKFAETYYIKNGKPTTTLSGIKVAMRVLKNSYGSIPASEFGPLALKALRQQLIDDGQSRGTINDTIARLCRMFKWAASEELVPPSVPQALGCVSGLRRGRTAARELPPVKPVSDAAIEATLPHLPPIIADMVRLHRLTGMRPSEVCILRPCDVDRSRDVWTYTPESHKTEHHGRARVICIGPKAQEILRPYLLRESTAYCFSPSEAEEHRRSVLHAERKTPIKYGNRPGTNRKRKPCRKAGDRYTKDSYARAVKRGCAKAFPVPDDIASNPDAARAWRRKHHWSPNRLRHTAASEIRKQYGLEAAQTVLGHAQASVTEIYAERDLSKAAEVIAKIG